MAEEKKLRWSKIVLVASLALNLIFVGLVAGAWINGPKRGDRDDLRPSWASGPFGRALSKEDRRAMGEAFRNDPEARQRIGSRRGQMRAIGVEIADVLRSQPFDPSKLESLFQKQAQLGAEMTQTGQRVLLERITRMTQEQRAGFADRLEAGMKRGRKHRKN